MPLELSLHNRPYVHPRRLTNVGLILKGEKKNLPGKRKGAKRPKPMIAGSPLSNIAWSLHQRRKQQYLADLNRMSPDA